MGKSGVRVASFVMLAVGAASLASMTVSSPTSASPAPGARAVPHADPATCNGTLAAGTVVGIAATSDDGGYWIANNQGSVVACGDAQDFGNLTTSPNRPIVGIAATPDGGGYYLVASDGGVFTFGDATFQGSTGGMQLNRPVVGMTVDPATGGYWLVASDGGIFAYHAPFYGSTGSSTLNQPIVGMAESDDGNGYWLVASDGGIFAYNAPFYGSTGSMHLNKPIVGMAVDLATGGYWLTASDGGIFAYGALFYGSTGSIVLNEPIVGMEANGSGSGYRFVASDGGVFPYGTSGFYGSAVAPLPVAPAPSPTPGFLASCSVTLSNSSPAQGTEETATITSNAINAPVTLAKAYETTTTYDTATTDLNGNATISFNVSDATVGFVVVVTVTVEGATCRTSFTPS